MKKKLNPVYFLFLFALVLYSCAKLDSTEEEAKNSETLIYENKKSDIKNPSVVTRPKLDSKLEKTYLINYQNDELLHLRTDTEWVKYLRQQKLTVNESDVKKSIIKNTTAIMYSISYTSISDNGVLNVYSTSSGHFWTKVSITKTNGNLDKYTITAKNGDLIIQLNLNPATMEISNISSPKSASVVQDFKTLGLSSDDTSINRSEGDNCYTRHLDYIECLQCLIVKNCGEDVACVIACTVAPSVCLGVAVLACMGKMQEQQKLYGQCGGYNWTGPTECEYPAMCVNINEFYSQCL
ncbi:hypothetical protein [Pedobacter hiemivivus]|uniref:CBM1 domain-containing protein n=1 Tax=Pedobacter hiemivivus TaxID=2530454 RepID=A0A4R0NBH5_9SPHI|nr:hypothetical protein [Pedobacter hiemivivus]TCC96282.1 hypothetical protein EZ444_12665 [Pedobacter hiemivivus]